MDGITIIFESPPGGIAPDQIDVIWRHGLAEIPDIARHRIEERWADYLAEAAANQKSLFNADITRLLHSAWQSAKLTLELAKTDYKSFVVTSIRDRDWFNAHAPSAITAGLGNSVLLTNAHHALLGIRSPAVSSYPNRAHVIGGVLELLNTPHLPASHLGILKHLQNEITEETSLTTTYLHPQPRLLGIVLDHHLAQPEMLWQWETNFDLAALSNRMKEIEHTGHILVDNHNIPPNILDQMTPVANAACQWWRKGSRL